MGSRVSYGNPYNLCKEKERKVTLAEFGGLAFDTVIVFLLYVACKIDLCLLNLGWSSWSFCWVSRNSLVICCGLALVAEFLLQGAVERDIIQICN